jgi:hypothetical protein
MNEYDFVNFLNNLLLIDEKAISNLFLHKTITNNQFADFENVFVLEDENKDCHCSILGIINGYLKKNGSKSMITAVSADDLVIYFELSSIDEL